MPIRTLILAVALVGAPSVAFAKADLDVSVTAPTAVVYDAATWDVTVANVGNRNANNVSLTIQLPETNTSPAVHILGDLGAFSGGCFLDGTAIKCSLGRVRKNQSATVSFDIALPASSAPIAVSAGASTTSSESDLANNTATEYAALTYYGTPIAAPRASINRHCTGQALTSFFECELYPSSIASHEILFEVGGTLSFVNPPRGSGFTGTWTQPTPDTLIFEYIANGYPVASFAGWGVGGDCFEGVTTFPNNPTWVSPYEVCLQ